MSCAMLMGESRLALTGNTDLLFIEISLGRKCASFVVSQKATAVGKGVILCASVGILNCLLAFTPTTSGSGQFVVAVLCALLRLMVFFGCRLKRVEIAVYS